MGKPLSAGDLRHRVTIQQRGTAVQNPQTGETVRPWVDVAQVWAAIAPVSVREYVASQAMQSAITTRITIRYRDGLDASMRITHVKNGVTLVYNPQGFLPDVDSGLEYLAAPCSLGVNDG